MDISFDTLIPAVFFGVMGFGRAVRSPLEASEAPALLEAVVSLSAAVVDDERRSSGPPHS